MGPVKGSKKRRKRDFSENETQKDWWVEFSKGINGLLSPSVELDKFELVFKISRKTFNYICSLVREELEGRSRGFSFSSGGNLSLNELVAVAIKRLGSGDSLTAVGEAFGMHHSTVAQVTWRFVEAMEKTGIYHLHWPKNEEEMTRIKSKFEKIRGFPNCCGAIDITHITMFVPSTEPAHEMWTDQEKNHSMLLQAIVDPDMKFRDIVTGWPGKVTDSMVLKSSNFFNLCEKGNRLNGKAVIDSKGSEIREYIVGDSGFPSLPWLVTPYRGKGLPECQEDFNRRHFATRMVARRALARLKDMWKVIDGVMWRPDKNKLPRIIYVTCLLHNIIIDMEDAVQDDLPLSHIHDVGYQQQISESADLTASDQRENLSLYLSRRLPS